MNTNKLLLFAIISILATSAGFSQTRLWTKKANPSNNAINSIVFKADGKSILSGTNCHPASIRIFDVNSGNISWDYNVGMSFMCIMGVSFSSNSNYIAAMEEFGNILIFDNTGSSPNIKDTVVTGTQYAFSTEISPSNDQVAVGCSNGKMQVYNISNASKNIDINAHTGFVWTVAYSPDGNYLITGGSDKKVKIWTKTGAAMRTLDGHTDAVYQVKVSNDGQYIVSCSADNTIRIWNFSDGKLLRTISQHKKAVKGVAISPDGSKIASASEDSSAFIFDFTTGKVLDTILLKDSSSVNAIAWSPDGGKIATGNANSDISIWDLGENHHSNINSNTNTLNVLISPIPAMNEITLFTNNSIELYELSITDIAGKLSKIRSLEGNKIAIDHLMPGIYILHIKGKDILESYKFIKQ